MSLPAADAAARERLRAELEQVPGVRRAFLEEAPPRVYLVCQRGESSPTEMTVRGVLARHGLSPTEASLHLCYLSEPQPHRRVRFVRAEVTHPGPGRARASVGLEWGGETFEGEEEGESGSAMELRLVALAAMHTLERVVDGAVSFHLIGIKSSRVFDAEVVVVLLRASGDSPQPLIGASITLDDPVRSAAFAVLNATNRVLGNFLVVED